MLIFLLSLCLSVNIRLLFKHISALKSPLFAPKTIYFALLTLCLLPSKPITFAW